MKALSLLSDQVFRVVTDDANNRDQVVSLTLPQVLALLCQGFAIDLVTLRPHQRPAWHAFLVQLAFLALEEADAIDLPTDVETWAALLRDLTPGHPGDEPWHLVVDDWTLPAFMQSPCLPGAQGDYRNPAASAQELDLLVTSKNHDEKLGKLRPAMPDGADVWVYALVDLQGFTPGLGPGNHNSMRMNGYFASRPQFRLVFEVGSGAEFLRDLRALQSAANAMLQAAEDAQIGRDESLALLWLPVWSAAALPLTRVHPLCLEVSRRIRLRQSSTGLDVLFATSATMRVAAKDNKGLVLDPWTPVINDGDSRALTAQADTFSYHRLAPLLFDDARCRLPLLAQPTPAEIDSHASATLLAQVLVGGSGRTDGFLRREVPLPTLALRQLVNQRHLLAARAASFIELAGLAQGKVLRAALLQFVDGSADVNWQNKDFGKAVAPWVGMLESRIDAVFFRELFATLQETPLSDADARSHWVAVLGRLAQQTFDLAVQALPTRDRSQQLARARAQLLLLNGLRKHLPAEPANNIGATKPRPNRRRPQGGSFALQEQDA